MKKLITLVVFVCFAFAVKAQSGDISGKVKDSNDWGIKLVHIIILDSAGGETGTGTQADYNGNYSITMLKPGKYNLQFFRKGYISQIVKGIVVNADKTTFVDVKMPADPNAPVGKKKK